jgi:hypothetical protein
MGCGQQDVEHMFTEQLQMVTANLKKGRQAPGILIKGGFGTGKSHLLEYLQHKALASNFVCSRVVISKETPLYDPAKVYRAAVESAVVPRLTGQAIQEIALRLRQDSNEYAELYQWCNRDAKINSLFPATLFLHEHLHNDPELVEEIRNFWAGERLPIAHARRGLREVEASSMYQLKSIPLRQFALERFVFAPRLILSAGYSGWVLLIDEVELIGRYSLLQRGKSYAELARWLGHLERDQYPGLATVAAITDDFDVAVLKEKGDRELIAPKLRSKQTDELALVAASAERGMRLIEREAVMLKTPDAKVLETAYARLKEVHAKAYSWDPPDIAPAERTIRRPMRSHIRRWINEWDLKRLYPGSDVTTEEQELRPTYAEDAEIETPPEAAADD